MFRINPPGNYRWSKQQPSASARTEREAIVSEDNIIFVNDLLPPHVGDISTYCAPAADSDTFMKASSSHVCEAVRMLVLHLYTNIQSIYKGVHVPFLSQVWLWIAGCRADGAAGRTLPHRCSAEEVYATSHALPPQVKKPFLSFNDYTLNIYFYRPNSC